MLLNKICHLLVGYGIRHSMEGTRNDNDFIPQGTPDITGQDVKKVQPTNTPEDKKPL